MTFNPCSIVFWPQLTFIPSLSLPPFVTLSLFLSLSCSHCFQCVNQHDLCPALARLCVLLFQRCHCYDYLTSMRFPLSLSLSLSLSPLLLATQFGSLVCLSVYLFASLYTFSPTQAGLKLASASPNLLSLSLSLPHQLYRFFYFLTSLTQPFIRAWVH